jgi:hypothetical protein
LDRNATDARHAPGISASIIAVAVQLSHVLLVQPFLLLTPPFHLVRINLPRGRRIVAGRIGPARREGLKLGVTRIGATLDGEDIPVDHRRGDRREGINEQSNKDFFHRLAPNV